MYLTIYGTSQGLISKGASSSESLGNTYKNIHEDEIMVTRCYYGASNLTHQGSGRPLGQGHSEAVMITKSIDKSTPLLHNAMNGELLSLVKLKCYRSSALGYPEHYYTILLRNARIVAMETSKGLKDSTPLEDVYFSYEEIIMEHETAHTLSQNKWGHSLALHKQRMQVLRNSANGYNTLMTSLEKRREFFKENPHYGDEKLKNFWMVSTLPLSASITGVGVMRAGWWAYRNPMLVYSGAYALNDILNPSMPASNPYIQGYQGLNSLRDLIND